MPSHHQGRSAGEGRLLRDNRSIAERDVACVVHGFTNLATLEEKPPVVIARGQGVHVYDEAGKEYIEGAAGMWCASFGFGERELIEAAIAQFEKLPYYHSFVDKTTAPMALLAEKLVALAPEPLTRVFFTNSGSEANDTLVKIIWYYNNARGRPSKKKIISRINGFHGLTVAAASLTGIPIMHAEFDLPIANILHTDLPHYPRRARAGETEEAFATRMADNLEKLILAEGPETVAAFIAEPVMGAGGVITPPEGYFAKIQAVLRRHDVLMLADEVITGFGRTGHMFGCETYGIAPDAMTVAKGLASAYQPIAGVLISEEIHGALIAQSRKLGFFAHAFTTTGHPVASAVALKTLELMEERDTLSHVRRVARRFQERLASFGDHPLIGEVRGVGLMGAVELMADKETMRPFDPSHKVKEHVRLGAQERGLIMRAVLAGDSLAFAPPLIITEDEIDAMFDRLGAALDDTLSWVDREGLREKTG
jgi:4-aminobutyrate--pyruvate transaminase